MGVFIIKKEDLKGDIIIEFDNNIIYHKDSGEVPLVSFVDGELKIKIKNQIIADKEVVKSINLTEEYKNKFRINGLNVESNFMKLLELKEMHGVNCLKI